MFKSACYTLIISFAFLSGNALSSTNSVPKQISLASTSWCPYICDEPDQPGFIVEYMTEQLSTLGVDLKVDVLPWSRAILLAEQGSYDGLLTAVSSEAPDFHLTKLPTGTYQVCLYKKAGRDISYVNRSSFQNLVLGGIKDYGYGEPIDSVISNPVASERSYLVSNNKPLESLINMTDRNRVDLFAEDRIVIGHFIKNNPQLALVEIAGCLEEVPFFTAISPNNPKKEYWLNLLNELFGAEKSKVAYQRAKTRYTK